jgi:hypothetical protein
MLLNGRVLYLLLQSRNAAVFEVDYGKSSNVVTNGSNLRDTIKVPANSVKVMINKTQACCYF